MAVRGAGLLAIGLLALLPAPATAQGPQDSSLLLTIAARECDEYADIRANLARNDIMESLQNLGEDTLYTSGEAIDPRTEQEGQPACRPITGWRFTIGDGIISRAVTGPWGALSIVTDPDAVQPVTQASVPARDFAGAPVPGATIPGAVTVGLAGAQADRAGGNALWIQGGTPEDPVLFSDPQFAGRYGFGALRCAIDDLNGDNVETVAYPTGTRHMYCYAYYVTPPPSSGTIVIRKQVEGSEVQETFHFGGNLSYNDGGAFDLAAADGSPASIEFVRGETRAGDAPWTAVEEEREGWTLASIDCTSGSSATTTDVGARSAQISLVAGDTVTCTFTNRLTPPAGALVLRKVTEGGTGRFPFRVRDAGGDVVARPVLTTRVPGGPGAVRAIVLDPGRYRIDERRPASRSGVWRLSSVACNGTRRPTGRPATVEVTAGQGAVCTFTNTLDHPGRIDVSGVTIGGLDSGAYITTPIADATGRRVQVASTRRQGEPALARGQSTHDLPFGSYTIQQTAAVTTRRGVWTLIAVTCNRRLVPFAQGRAVVRLTRAQPEQRCTFVNLRQREPGPEPDPDPDPSPDPSPDPQPEPGGPKPDLALTKRLARSTGGPIPTLTFALRVTNRSAVTATRVVVADRLAPGTAYVSADPSQGRCFLRGTRLVVCTLGDLAPGESATIRVRVQQTDPGAGVNVAVTGSGSPEDVLRNNVAAARIAAVRRQAPGACPSARAPVARAAC